MTGRTDEALTAHREVLDLRRRLVQDRPKAGQYQDRLASSLFDFADCLDAAGRLDEARHVEQEALTVLENLVRDQPGVESYKGKLANAYVAMARTQADARRSADALAWLDRAGTIYDELAAKNRRQYSDRGQLSGFQFARGKALEASGDLGEAVGTYERSKELIEKMPVLYSWNHFDLACVYARVCFGNPAAVDPRSCRWEQSGIPGRECGRRTPACLGCPLPIRIALP
jgi:tetratricopeptide (TPR) repeat protein